MKCSKCDLDAVKAESNIWFCSKHHRFVCMRHSAARNKKVVPTFSELELMINDSMLCPDCSVTMVWYRSESTTRVASLQHYRDGTIGIVCLSCNSRHQSMAGDTYRNMPKEMCLCTRCSSLKPRSKFSTLTNSRRTKYKYCLECRQEENKENRILHRMDEDCVKKVKILISQGISDRKIASYVGYSRSTIQLIRKGKSWKNVTV